MFKIPIKCNKSIFVLIFCLILPSGILSSQPISYHDFNRFNSENIKNIDEVCISDSVIKHTYHEGKSSRDIEFYFNLGLTFDSEYSDYLDKAFESNGRELSGFTGWINLGIGLNFKLNNNFYLSPSVTGRFSRIGIKDAFSYTSTVRYINALYSIGFGGTFIYPIDKTAIYLNAKILGNLSGSDSGLEKNYDFEYETNGIGFEFALGCRLSSGGVSSFSLEIGYSIIPVSILPVYSYNPDNMETSKNFGGMFLNFAGNFGLWDY